MINLKNNMLMNKKKSLYEAPTTNILVVRVEGSLLTGSNGTQVSGTRGGYSYYSLDSDD